MSYRIVLGMSAEWAERSVPSEISYRDAAWAAVAEGAKVIAANKRYAGRFVRAARKAGLSREFLFQDTQLVLHQKPTRR